MDQNLMLLELLTILKEIELELIKEEQENFI